MHTSSCWRSIVTMALSCIIFEIKRYGENRDFFSYTLHSTPPSGSPLRNISITFDVNEPQWCGYWRWKSFTIMFSRFERYTLACNRQTDRQMDILLWHSPHLCRASRGKMVDFRYPSIEYVTQGHLRSLK